MNLYLIKIKGKQYDGRIVLYSAVISASTDEDALNVARRDPWNYNIMEEQGTISRHIGTAEPREMGIIHSYCT